MREMNPPSLFWGGRECRARAILPRRGGAFPPRQRPLQLKHKAVLLVYHVPWKVGVEHGEHPPRQGQRGYQNLQIGDRLSVQGGD